MSKPTPANCLRISVQHEPHEWTGHTTYWCDGEAYRPRTRLGYGSVGDAEARGETTPAVARPTVGRIVHYVSHGTPVRDDGTQAHESKCRAAIVIDVPLYLSEEPMDGCPNGTDGLWEAALAVLNPTGVFFNEGLLYDPSGAGGSWHWPERE